MPINIDQIKEKWNTIESSLEQIRSFPDFLITLFRLNQNIISLSVLDRETKADLFSDAITKINKIRNYLDYMVGIKASFEWSGVFFDESELKKYPKLKQCVPLFQQFYKCGHNLIDFLRYILEFLSFHYNLVNLNTFPLDSYKSIYPLANIFNAAFYKPAFFVFLDKKVLAYGDKIVKTYGKTLKRYKSEAEKDLKVGIVPLFIDPAIFFSRAQAGLSVLECYLKGKKDRLRHSIVALQKLEAFLIGNGGSKVGDLYTIDERSYSFRKMVEFLGNECEVFSRDSFRYVFKKKDNSGYYWVFFPSLTDFYVKSFADKDQSAALLNENPWSFVKNNAITIDTSIFASSILLRELDFCKNLYRSVSIQDYFTSFIPDQEKLKKTTRELLIFLLSKLIADQLAEAKVVSSESTTEVLAVSGLLYILLSNLLPPLNKHE